MTLSTGITGEYGPGASRQLMANGKWCVPPEQRPRGWESMGLAEPDRISRFSELDREIAQMPADKPEPWRPAKQIEPPKPAKSRFVGDIPSIVEKAQALKPGQEFELEVPEDEEISSFANRLRSRLNKLKVPGRWYGVGKVIRAGVEPDSALHVSCDPAPVDPVAQSVSEPEPPVLATQAAKVLESIKAGAQTSKDVEAATGLPLATVSAKLSELADKGFIRKVGEVKMPGASRKVHQYEATGEELPEREEPSNHQSWEEVIQQAIALKEGESFDTPVNPGEKPAKYANRIRCALNMRREASKFSWSVTQNFNGEDTESLHIRRGKPKPTGLEDLEEHSTVVVERSYVVESASTPGAAVDTVQVVPLAISPGENGENPVIILPEPANNISDEAPLQHLEWSGLIPADPPGAAQRLLELQVEAWNLDTDTQEGSDRLGVIYEELPMIAKSAVIHRAAKVKVDRTLGEFFGRLKLEGSLINEGSPADELWAVSPAELQDLFQVVHGLVVAEMETKR